MEGEALIQSEVSSTRVVGVKAKRGLEKTLCKVFNVLYFVLKT